MDDKRKIAAFLEKAIEWKWDEFMKAEIDPGFTANEGTVLALIRTCALENLSAIRTAIERIDGKQEQEIQVRLPSVFFLYPGAEESPHPMEIGTKSGEVVVIGEDAPSNVPTKGLRSAAKRMGDAPRSKPQEIIAQQEMAEEWFRRDGAEPEYFPYVKSVIVARMFNLGHKRKMAAINQLFDDIDGKLVEKIRIVGEDMLITKYVKVAPPGAVRGPDGVLMMEATKSQDMWRSKLQGETVEATVIEGEDI